MMTDVLAHSFNEACNLLRSEGQGSRSGNVDLWSPCWWKEGVMVEPWLEGGGHGGDLFHACSFSFAASKLLRQCLIKWLFKKSFFEMAAFLQDGCVLSQAIGANPGCSHHSQFG